MNEENILKSTARFPFKKVKGKRGVKYRQKIGNSDKSTVLEVEHNGHDHLLLDFRSLTKKENGKSSNKRLLHWSFDTKSAVQFASLIMYMAEEFMANTEEEPIINVVNSKERTGFGPNWLHEEYDSAVARLEKRRSRSYLFSLVKRCMETCDDEEFIKFLLINLSLWADSSGDEFAEQQAEKAISQLGLIPEEMIN
jgi:hypothetical protein